MDDEKSASSASRRGPAPTKHVDILWAAARLFGERGVAQTSTREIAAAAGTTERTLFKHFGSKDRLVEAVISQAVVEHLAPASMQALRRAIEAHDDDLASWHGTLLAARDAAMARAPELARLLWVELIRDAALRERFATAWKAAVWAPLRELIARLQRERRVRRDVPAETLARVFLSMNLGYLLGRHVLAPEMDWDEKLEIAAIAALFRDATAARVITAPRKGTGH
jgi:AcrR family transcriptional regulator